MSDKHAHALPRLQERYQQEIREHFVSSLLQNILQVPKLEKIVLNMGVGEAAGDQKNWMPPLRRWR